MFFVFKKFFGVKVVFLFLKNFLEWELPWARSLVLAIFAKSQNLPPTMVYVGKYGSFFHFAF